MVCNLVKKKAKTTTNFYTAQIFSDSIGNLADSINYNETSTKKSDEEILKEQEKREKELEKIIKKFKIDKKETGLFIKFFVKNKSNLINFRKIKILKSGQLIQTIQVLQWC